MENFFYEDIKFVISKYLKLNDAKNFLSLNKNFRKQFVLIYHISIVNYSNLYNNFILKGISMENIRHIYFDDSFNQQLDKLPQSLISLTINGDSFDQQVDKLPQSLTSLSLGDSFNQQIDKLPQSLTSLTINGDSF